MMMDYISLAGFILSVFVAGIAFGKFAEKIDRLIRKLEEEEHEGTLKGVRQCEHNMNKIQRIVRHVKRPNDAGCQAVRPEKGK